MKLVEDAKEKGYVIYMVENKKEDWNWQEYIEIPEGWEARHCGGRYAYIVVYDPKRIDVWFLTTREAGEFEENTPCFVIDLLPASVHGWWKCVKHQACAIVDKNHPCWSEENNEEENYIAYSLARELEKGMLEEIAPQIGDILSRLKNKKLKVIDGDKTLSKYTYKNCPYCKRAKEKARERGFPWWEERECLVHSIVSSLNMSTFNESGRWDYNYRLPQEVLPDWVEKGLYHPTNAIALAVLDKNGDVWVIKNLNRPIAVKLNSYKKMLFGK